MKILFLTMGYPSRRNPSRIVFLQRLVNELRDQGHECTVVSPIKRPAEKPVDGNKETHLTAMNNTVEVYFPQYFCCWLGSKFPKDLFAQLSVHNYVKVVVKTINQNNIQFDCVYSHFLGISAFASLHIAKMYGVPAVAAAGESHFSIFDGYDSDRAHKYLNELSGIISVSSENKELLLKNDILTEDKIIVLPNGVDSKMFYPRSKVKAREMFGFDQDDFIVGFTGHFIERKGVLRVSQATMEAKVKVAYAGKGGQQPCEENAVWCKPVNPEQMPLFLSSLDLFVLPTFNEGCCNAIIESIACGVPVISSDRAFNDDILDDSYSIRIDPNNIKEIRDAILSLKNDEILRDEMALRAAEQGKLFSLENRARLVGEWLQQVVTNGNIHELSEKKTII